MRKGQHMTAEQRKHCSAAARKSWDNKATHDRRVASQHTPEAKRNYSAASIAKWEDDSYRKKVLAGMKKVNSAEATKENRSLARKKLWADPAYHARVAKLIAEANRDPSQRTLERNKKISQTLLDGYATGRIALPKPYVGRNCGWMLTKKGGRMFYKSNPEKAFAKALDACPNVIKFKNEPFRLPYFLDSERHTYYPDFLVELSTGKKLLAELKPLWVFGHKDSKKKIAAKMEAAAEYCSIQKMDFTLFTDYK